MNFINTVKWSILDPKNFLDPDPKNFLDPDPKNFLDPDPKNFLKFEENSKKSKNPDFFEKYTLFRNVNRGYSEFFKS